MTGNVNGLQWSCIYAVKRREEEKGLATFEVGTVTV
jgi:hypothetical protein